MLRLLLIFHFFFRQFIFASNDSNSTFVVSFDCNSRPGCASDLPSWESQAFLGRVYDAYICTRGEAICAFLCRENDSCVGFNYLRDVELCQFFTSRAFKIDAREYCSNFQIPLVVKTGQNLTNVNVALGKRTCRSSSLTNHYSWNAVDGTTTNNLLRGDCSYDQGDKVFNWLMIDLEASIVLNRVRILIVDSYLQRYKNLKVGITNTSWLEKQPVKDNFPLCGINQANSPNSSWLTIPCSRGIPPGRFLIIQQGNLTLDTSGYMPLCEVEAFVA